MPTVNITFFFFIQFLFQLSMILISVKQKSRVTLCIMSLSPFSSLNSIYWRKYLLSIHHIFSIFTSFPMRKTVFCCNFFYWNRMLVQPTAFIETEKNRSKEIRSICWVLKRSSTFKTKKILKQKRKKIILFSLFLNITWVKDEIFTEIKLVNKREFENNNILYHNRFKRQNIEFFASFICLVASSERECHLLVLLILIFHIELPEIRPKSLRMSHIQSWNASQIHETTTKNRKQYEKSHDTNEINNKLKAEKKCNERHKSIYISLFTLLYIIYPIAVRCYTSYRKEIGGSWKAKEKLVRGHTFNTHLRILKWNHTTLYTHTHTHTPEKRKANFTRYIFHLLYFILF